MGHVANCHGRNVVKLPILQPVNDRDPNLSLTWFRYTLSSIRFKMQRFFTTQGTNSDSSYSLSTIPIIKCDDDADVIMFLYYYTHYILQHHIIIIS